MPGTAPPWPSGAGDFGAHSGTAHLCPLGYESPSHLRRCVVLVGCLKLLFGYPGPRELLSGLWFLLACSDQMQPIKGVHCSFPQGLNPLPGYPLHPILGAIMSERSLEIPRVRVGPGVLVLVLALVLVLPLPCIVQQESPETCLMPPAMLVLVPTVSHLENQPHRQVGRRVAGAGLPGPDRVLCRAPGERPLAQVLPFGRAASMREGEWGGGAEGPAAPRAVLTVRPTRPL